MVWSAWTRKRVPGGLASSDWEKNSRLFGLLGLRRVLGGLVCLDWEKNSRWFGLLRLGIEFQVV